MSTSVQRRLAAIVSVDVAGYSRLVGRDEERTIARLRALLRRSAELRPPQLAVGDLVLDTAGQSAARGGRAIALTHKEYALLEYLVRNAGRVVSRTEIAEHVWDESFDPFSNLIEVYINRLRRKVDPDGSAELLQTRRGSGYVLRASQESGRTVRTRADASDGKSGAAERKRHA